MTVLALWGGGEPGHMTRLHLPEHLLETHGRKMVALVDDDMAIVGHQIIHDLLPVETLDDRDIQGPIGAAPSSPDLPDALEGKIQERRQPLPPLVQELSAMHEHQGVHATRGDEPGGHDRFPKGGRGGQDAVVMSQQVVGGGLLIRPERSLKRHVQRQTGKPLVLDGDSHLVRLEQGRDFFEATPG